MSDESSKRTPRVFISYSNESEEHSAQVLQLAAHLRSDGVDAWVDRYEMSPEDGWPRWMTKQVEEADFILLICSEIYRLRFEGG